jgi:DNA-binding transcriptional LysR family regulator
MNLRGVDLNLLTVLDAVIAERHVSRAAARLGMSQPAVAAPCSGIR